MSTIFQRDFVKPFPAGLIIPGDTPILKPEQIDPKDWLTVDI